MKNRCGDELTLHLYSPSFKETCLFIPPPKQNLHGKRCALRALPSPKAEQRAPLPRDLRFHLQGSALPSMARISLCSMPTSTSPAENTRSFLPQQVQYTSLVILVGLWSAVQKAKSRLWKETEELASVGQGEVCSDSLMNLLEGG